MSTGNDLSAPRGAGRTGWILGLAIAVGLLRFWRLGDWGLWIDEAFTLHDLRGIFSHSIPAPSNPLGYRMVGWFVKFAGDESEWSLRFVPAVFGFAVIPLVAWAFRPFASPRVASLAALFVAASSWQLYWSQNARFYSIAQFFSVLAGGALARALFAAGERSIFVDVAWTLAFAVASGLAALSHPSAALFCATLGAAPIALWLAGIRPTRSFSRTVVVLVVAGALGAIVAAPWAGSAWQKYKENKADSTPLHLVLTTGFYVTPWLGFAALVGAARALRRRAAFELWGLIALFATFVAALVLSLQARVSAQYVFAGLPWIALLAASAVEARAGERAPRFALFAFLLVAPGLADQAHYFAFRNGDREHWREAYRYVWNQREPEDLIVGMAAPVGEYYLAPQSSSLKQPSMLVPLTTHNSFVPEQWARRERRTWFIVLDEWLADWSKNDRAAFRAYLDSECKLVADFRVPQPFRDLSVHVYLRE